MERMITKRHRSREVGRQNNQIVLSKTNLTWTADRWTSRTSRFVMHTEWNKNLNLGKHASVDGALLTDRPRSIASLTTGSQDIFRVTGFHHEFPLMMRYHPTLDEQNAGETQSSIEELIPDSVDHCWADPG
jgi:hypothetical protein